MFVNTVGRGRRDVKRKESDVKDWVSYDFFDMIFWKR